MAALPSSEAAIEQTLRHQVGLLR